MPSERVLRQPIQFRAGDLSAEILARTEEGGFSPSEIARRDLERYYGLLKRSLPAFSDPEGALIVDVLNGAYIEAHSARVVWASVADAIHHDGVAEKWGVDGGALVERLRALTPFEQMAIADAAERFWRSDALPEDLFTALRRVGLVRDPMPDLRPEERPVVAVDPGADD